MNENECYKCLYFKVNDYVTKIYGEGNGACSERNEVVFCTKHNCPWFKSKWGDDDDQN